MQLVRLCKDESLARALWENIISNRLCDGELHFDFPWLLSEDLPIPGLLTANDMIDKAAENFKSSITNGPPLLVETWRRPGVATAATGGLEVDTSSTVIDIEIDDLTMNYVDLLLGPRMARFQIKVSKGSIAGGVAHYGVFPDLLTSVYSVVSSLTGHITVECSFFNTYVGTMEPFVEPYTLEFSVLKSEAEEILSIQLSDCGQVVCNLSSAWIRTVTSIALSLNQTTTLRYFPEDTVSLLL